MNEDQLMSVDQMAAYLQVSKWTVYKLLRSGELPGIRIGTQWRVSKEELDKILKPHAAKQ